MCISTKNAVQGRRAVVPPICVVAVLSQCDRAGTPTHTQGDDLRASMRRLCGPRRVNPLLPTGIRIQGQPDIFVYIPVGRVTTRVNPRYIDIDIEI